MRRFLPALLAVVGLLFGIEGVHAQAFKTKYEMVAVTEFMNTPIGEKDSRCWVELFNFGKEDVDLEKWSIVDAKNDIVEFPKATIKAGDYAIIVIGHDVRRFEDERKKLFEAEWLGGKEDPRVIGVDGRLHLDLNDQIVLQNRRKVPIWIMGWRSDAVYGSSTYLAEPNFDVRNYGTAEKPGINRRGKDGTILGYESQDATKEADAYKSDVSKLEAIGGILYQSKENGGKNEPSLGSPLKGGYKQKP